MADRSTVKWRSGANHPELVIDVEGEDHPAMPGHRLAKHRVVCARLGHDNAKPNGTGVTGNVEKLRIVVSPQGPLPQFPERFFVDGRNDDLLRGVLHAPEPEGKIVEVIVGPIEKAEMLRKEDQ
jgi:hypothetical protein